MAFSWTRPAGNCGREYAGSVYTLPPEPPSKRGRAAVTVSAGCCQSMESFAITRSRARRMWLRAQRLDTPAPFGSGPEATPAAIRHLGYVQIDTIHVIERCHHHILFARIPEYRREYLHRAQSVDKTIFEYWTHALSYIPFEDIRYYVRAMRRYWRERHVWFTNVKDNDVRKVL